MASPHKENNKKRSIESDPILKVTVRLEDGAWKKRHLSDASDKEKNEDKSDDKASSSLEPAKKIKISSPNSNGGTSDPLNLSSTDDEQDNEYELTADDMVHDFDDESTIAQEENEEDEDELEDLAKEGNMDIEDLYQLYYGKFPSEQAVEDSGTSENDEAAERNSSANDIVTNNLRSRSLMNSRRSNSGKTDSQNLESESDGESGQANSGSSTPKRTATPRVGKEYQAVDFPEARPSSAYRDEVDHTSELVWSPTVLTEKQVERYLRECWESQNTRRIDIKAVVHDNQKALAILAKNNYVISKALMEFRSTLSQDTTIKWTESECELFEKGNVEYGKDFFKIHHSYLSTKSVKEIIQFYYVWKKSKRFEGHRNKNGKKRDSCVPGVSDYMERLLDETDNQFHIQYPTNAYFYSHTDALREHMNSIASKQNGFVDNDYYEDDNIYDRSNMLLHYDNPIHHNHSNLKIGDENIPPSSLQSNQQLNGSSTDGNSNNPEYNFDPSSFLHCQPPYSSTSSSSS